MGACVQGKRNHTPPCCSDEIFFAEKKGGLKDKMSVVDMVALVSKGFFESTTGLFFFAVPKSYPKYFLPVVVVVYVWGGVLGIDCLFVCVCVCARACVFV